MYRIHGFKRQKLVVNKSEFITSIYNVTSLEEINEILSKVKKEYFDANHNCYAYILGDNSDVQKCSDDGEPSKTAGFPMLNVLKKHQLTNILVIVTRYFGGVLLGAGGLIRAYSSSVSEVLKDMPLFCLQTVNEYVLTTDYSTYNNLLNLIKTYPIKDSSFTTDVKLVITIPSKDTTIVLKSINNLAMGKAFVTQTGEYQVEVLVSDI